MRARHFCLQVFSVFLPALLTASLVFAQEFRVLGGHEKPVITIAFSPDGRLLASGGWEDTILLWDVSSGTKLKRLAGHERGVRSVAFSPDGQLLASGSGDMTIRLWEVSSGEELRRLGGHERSAFSVAFSPDGRLLASGSIDKTIRPWKVPSLGAPAVVKAPSPVPEPPPVAEPPTPEPRVEPALQGLLALADSRFSRKHYTTPKGDNTFETLKKVLRQDPANKQALQRLQEMAQIYRGWGDRDFGRGSLERARQNYEKILIIFPEDREALDQLAAINSAEQEEATRIAREEEERHRGDQEGVASVPPEERTWRSAGSGFFLAGSTHILTSNHVVRDVEEIRVSFPSGEQYQGSVVARDANNDLALVLLRGIQPKSGGFVTDLSAEVQAGEQVHAIGYPLGAGLSREPSIVSGQVNATTGLGDNIAQFRMDAAINEGNSGGPVINEFGKLIGIARAGLIRQGVEGIRFGTKLSAASLVLGQAQIEREFTVQVTPRESPVRPQEIFSDFSPFVVLIETR